MIGLIRKDLYYLFSSWKPILLSVLILGGFSVFNGYGAIVIVILPTFFGLSILGCTQADAQNNWYTYHKVLPISLKDVVLSRYLSFLAFVCIGFIASFLYGYGVQICMGIESLGKNFTMLQAFMMGLGLAFAFGSFYIPATYYNKGEKMELSMILSGFISFGFVYLAAKVLTLLGVNLMESSEMFIQIVFVIASIAIIISLYISILIYKKVS